MSRSFVRATSLTEHIPRDRLNHARRIISNIEMTLYFLKIISCGVRKHKSSRLRCTVGLHEPDRPELQPMVPARTRGSP
jgi:hypothetical protein